MVRALGALCSLQSKKKLAAGRRRETLLFSNEEKEKWIKDPVERETAVARKPVEDAETAIKQSQEELRNAENTGLTTTKPDTTLEGILNTIADILSDFEHSDDGQDGGR